VAAAAQVGKAAALTAEDTAARLRSRETDGESPSKTENSSTSRPSTSTGART
jgi:hypothetical protein